MNVTAFEGPAGYGKTHALFEELERELAAHPLQEHQRVLTLTYMQGARRRLEATLREKTYLKNRFEAITIDSFAWRLCQRWRSLIAQMGCALPGESAYEPTCTLAARLLEENQVRKWISSSYPVIIIDEAQDLNQSRMRVVGQLAHESRLLVAYDEFQCLDPELRPIAITEWLPGICTPRSMTTPRRTSIPELLAAATAIRSGTDVSTDNRNFKAKPGPHRSGYPPTLAAIHLASWIRSHRGSLTVLTPTRRGFATDVVRLVQAGPVGNNPPCGPYPILWEESEKEEVHVIETQFSTVPVVMSFSEAIAELQSRHHLSSAIRTTLAWLDRRRRTTGLVTFTRDEVLAYIRRTAGLHRRYRRPSPSSLLAMTIHQAKNREFEHIVVLWPHRMSGDTEHKRRLLYNAVTRARQSCLIIVQDERMLNSPPFSAA